MTTTRTISLQPDLPLTLTEAGIDHGRPVLVLHGGGGPATVAGLVEHFARSARVTAPVHPGWQDTPRPAWFTGVDDLALTYLHLLHDHGLRDVVVVGTSLGGWIAAEMAVRDTAGLISGLVLIDAVGVHVEGEPIRDFFALGARGVADHAWHDSDRYFVDPATLPATQLTAQQSNMAALRALAGDPYMHDPKLRGRLGRVRTPALLLWGAGDRIVTPAYGAAYAAAFGNARLHVIPEAGHLPHIEQPEAVFALVDEYLRTIDSPSPVTS
ncbi:alpha/beta fold hydrolase [Streptomyces goshikiensis]|uniref:alpha/beta fold hydrolase n=1 Tax=Streptomyces goshikiensis TaxID=1942 RepID=UPI0022F3CF9C|nr:alpha/beta hydrolase [Streptomyces goshikiensis]WBY18230.1 alpha/beta hydrolase [Streptomyces goshikiensis]WSS02865.1 alpha/beta hydrolase [Streptomyces goshikiensis]